VICSIVLSAAIQFQTCYGTNWNTQFHNDPPGTPSVKAALVATQGMKRQEIVARLALLRHAWGKGRSTADGDSIRILKREIMLLEVALENK
jgi:hypothetical protein